MVERMSHVDKRCCGLRKAEVSDKKQVLRMTRTEFGGADRLYPRVTFFFFFFGINFMCASGYRTPRSTLQTYAFWLHLNKQESLTLLHSLP